MNNNKYLKKMSKEKSFVNLYNIYIFLENNYKKIENKE